MTLLANATKYHSLENDNSKRKTISLTEKTYNRFSQFGKWGESADDLLNKILDEKEGKEVNESERSF